MRIRLLLIVALLSPGAVLAQTVMNPGGTVVLGGGSGGSSAPATSSTPGTVQLPTGQTSTTLSKVSITGAYSDLSGLPAPATWVAGSYNAGAAVTYTPAGGTLTTYVSAISGNTSTPGSSGTWLAYSDGPGAAAQVQSNLNAETTARTSAISSEASTRAAADTANANAISSEATTRASAISSEATTRAAADTTNATAAAAAQTTANAAVVRAGDTMTGGLGFNTTTSGTADDPQAVGGAATAAGDANVPLASANASGSVYCNLALIASIGGWGESCNGGAYAAFLTAAGAINNLAGGTADSVPYQTAAGTTAFVAPPTTAGFYVYAEQPTGTAAAPAFVTMASTNLSDSAAVVRNNQANTFAAGQKQTFTGSSSTAGFNIAEQSAAPTNPAAGDFWILNGGTPAAYWYDNNSLAHRIADTTISETWSATQTYNVPPNFKEGVVRSGIGYPAASFTINGSYDLVYGNDSSGSFTITLDTAPTIGEEHTFVKQVTSANTITISGGTINGSSSYAIVLTNYYETVRVRYISSGLGWAIEYSNLGIPTSFYSAAGVPVPPCNASNPLNVGRDIAVSDATSMTPGTAYTSGGTYKVHVECIENTSGPTYGYYVH